MTIMRSVWRTSLAAIAAALVWGSAVEVWAQEGTARLRQERDTERTAAARPADEVPIGRAREAREETVEELLERAEELARRLRYLGEDDVEEAARVRAELQRIRGQIGALRRRVPAEETAIEQMERQIAELRAQRRLADEAGRFERAVQLEREIAQLERRLIELEAARMDRPEAERFEERMRHVRAAVARLRAAGMRDLAEMVLMRARRIEDTLGRSPAEYPLARRPVAPRQVPPEVAADSPSVEELHRIVTELRRELWQTREEVRDLREQVEFH